MVMKMRNASTKGKRKKAATQKKEEKEGRGFSVFFLLLCYFSAEEAARGRMQGQKKAHEKRGEGSQVWDLLDILS